jgi:hypothetical protein
MGAAAKRLLFTGAVVLFAGVALGAPVTAADANGTGGSITITPAAVKLELAKGANEATTTVNITNNYSAAVALHFTLEKPQQHTGTSDTARGHITFSNADVTVAAGDTLKQVVTLHDAAAITPGSQSADMVVTHGSQPGQGIGVLPSMRLPVTIIKQDGAITSLGLTNIAGPSVAMNVPATINVTLHNTGNMVAIPRGVVAVESPSGNMLASGVLNEASLAVSPGNDIKLAAKLTKLGSAVLPGAYTVRVSYGLGGDAAASTATKQFLFVAWWQPLLVAALAFAGWYLITQRDIFHRPRKKQFAPMARPAPKRPLLIGRHIS